MNEWWLLHRRDEEILRAIEASTYTFSSGFNEQLLADAIADAKAVRATALANAREALEEAFSKHICH